MLTSIIPNPLEKVVSECVQKSMKVAETTAASLPDRRLYYWYLIHYYATKLVASHLKPTLPEGTAPEAQCVRKAARHINARVATTGMDADQTDVFYKELHLALCKKVEAEEREKSKATSMMC